MRKSLQVSDRSPSAAAALGTSVTWLMLVDMQRIFAQPDSAWFTPGFAAACAGAARLHAAFPARTVFTRFVLSDQPDGLWSRYYRDWPFASAEANAPLYDLVPDLPVGQATVVDRPTFGKWDRGIRDALPGVSAIVLAGVSTDCCVLSTALAAADDGVRVRVVADACAGVSDLTHRRALDAMALYAPFIEITTVEAVLAAAVGMA